MQYNYKHIEWRRRIQSQSRFGTIGNWKLGRQCVPRPSSPVFKAIERLSYSQELGILYWSQERKMRYFTPSYRTASIEREQGSRWSKMLKIYLVSPSPTRQHKTHPAGESRAVIVTNDPFFAESVIIVVRVFGANKALGVTWYPGPAHHYPVFVTIPESVMRQAREYCDPALVTLHSGALLPRPRHLKSEVHPTSRPCTAAHCWVLRLKLTPGATQIWDRVGIDIDPSQTNERPQISECGAARS